MHIAVTGATGFLGRYIVNLLTRGGHTCRCWHRPASDRGGFENERAIQWIEGGLEHAPSIAPLLDGADAVVHAGLHRPPSGGGHRGADAAVEFAQVNLMGTLRLFAAAKEGRIGRFVFVSTCGVHDLILDDRPLDETHPLWPKSYNCCDLFVCAEMAAAIAKDLTGSHSDIKALNKGPKHLIDTSKIQKLGMKFSGRARLEHYVRELIDAQ